MAIILTNEEKEILLHLVDDPDEWASRPIVTRKHVDDKVARIKQLQDVEIAKGNYRNCIERRQDEEQAKHDSWAVGLANAQAQKKLDNSLFARYELFRLYVDPFISRANNPDSGETTVPQEIRDYYTGTKALLITADAEIDALTTVKQCFEYEPSWLTPPII